jgi:uncharacterized protein YbaA (DUF1428 family)
MSYVDGYILPIPKKKVNVYLKMARMGEKYWRKAGALDYRECVAEDLRSAWGTTFTKTMKLKPGETVVFAYVVFKSRAHRDQVNKKVMKEMEKLGEMPEMPFNVKRMVYGGFKTLVGK